MKRTRFIGLCISVCVPLLAVLTAALVLRHLGTVVGWFLPPAATGELDLAAIFAQTREAEILPHALIPLALGVGVFTVFALHPPRPRALPLKWAAWSAVWVVCFLLSFLVSLLLTRVNEIRFGDLLAALLPMLDAL